MEQQDWAARIGRGIAGEVRRHRTAKGWSAQQLSDRCAELGMPVPRTVLSNLENGRRTNVTVAEVLILACALDVAPAALIFPAGYAESVEVVPGIVAHPMRGIQWISGETALPDGKSGSMGKMMRTALFFMRQLLQAKTRTQKAMGDGVELHRRALETDDPAAADAYEKASQQQFMAFTEGKQAAEEWTQALRSGMPEMDMEPIPFPDVDPGGSITIEMLPDVYKAMAAVNTWDRILAKREERESGTGESPTS
ncbi:helix-turn-helix transcriptional regulator [Streptomyces parvulus]|uniref:helix-turn-helix domain-containing protein n=1 Tax=Streptomyces parvulus TaxID=146923 RepID=UPI00333154FB